MCGWRGGSQTARQVSAPVCLGPLAVDASASGVPGLLLAGDAAGFVDPMTGDGLRFAFQGAELAAAEALYALEHGADEAHLRLHEARRRAFAAKWRFNRALRALVASPAAVSAAGFAAAAAPALLRWIIRYAGDLPPSTLPVSGITSDPSRCREINVR
jgi:menaquinone-9 beta-reductase